MQDFSAFLSVWSWRFDRGVADCFTACWPHLERVDSQDTHLRAGLVGAICGVRSLGMSLPSPLAGADALAIMVKDLLIGWMPLIGSALVLYGTQRMFSVSRP